MVQIEIKRGSTTKTIDCDFAGETFDGTFFARFTDARRLPKVAQDFDKIDSIKLIDSLVTKDYTQYSKLIYMASAGDSVTIRLAKEEKGEA